MMVRFVSKEIKLNSFTGHEVPAERFSTNLVKEDEKFFYCGPLFVYKNGSPLISERLSKEEYETESQYLQREYCEH